MDGNGVMLEMSEILVHGVETKDGRLTPRQEKVAVLLLLM